MSFKPFIEKGQYNQVFNYGTSGWVSRYLTHASRMKYKHGERVSIIGKVPQELCES